MDKEEVKQSNPEEFEENQVQQIYEENAEVMGVEPSFRINDGLHQQPQPPTAYEDDEDDLDDDDLDEDVGEEDEEDDLDDDIEESMIQQVVQQATFPMHSHPQQQHPI